MLSTMSYLNGKNMAPSCDFTRTSQDDTICMCLRFHVGKKLLKSLEGESKRRRCHVNKRHGQSFVRPSNIFWTRVWSLTYIVCSDIQMTIGNVCSAFQNLRLGGINLTLSTFVHRATFFASHNARHTAGKLASMIQLPIATIFHIYIKLCRMQ